jgi:hypothetical protein
MSTIDLSFMKDSGRFLKYLEHLWAQLFKFLTASTIPFYLTLGRYPCGG